MWSAIWSDLAVSGVPLLEKVIRTVAVYAALAVLLRVLGKRDTAQLNTMDLALMLLLANVVQNAIIGEDYSLVGGLLGAVVLLATDALVVRSAAARAWTWRALNGTPIVLARDGSYDRAALRRLAVRRSDVDVLIKKQGAHSVAETTRVVLEPGGAVLVEMRPERRPATGADAAALHERLRRIEELLERDRPQG
ncbi:DUF421 domain-containing protein [Streptomonospora salina]|uniref:Uncharacterized membrane protein YcaP (DUF421 family) n=1 Tax=Streptomonospora salina TaxID=104205 RepID=A0A841EA21_9ACTN|nr:YetF domain-containing protein [Streptomonospora salina]MBB5996301.1 uncharacterized membrane protein YcaP (DUF421 family) [Streptomonospora salina]